MYAVTRDDSQAVAAAPIWRGGADAEAEKKIIKEGGRGPIKIWFGGSYRECWSQDYALTVVYGDRRYVLAARGRDGRWSAAGCRSGASSPTRRGRCSICGAKSRTACRTEACRAGRTRGRRRGRRRRSGVAW